jgi:hypothetical protein
VDRNLAIVGLAWGAERAVEAPRVLSCEVSSLPYRGEPGEPSPLEARPARPRFQKALAIQPNHRQAMTKLHALSEPAHPRRSR